jgi:hypothetical protein
LLVKNAKVRRSAGDWGAFMQDLAQDPDGFGEKPEIRPPKQAFGQQYG